MSFDGDQYPNTAAKVITTRGDIIRGNSSGERARYGIGASATVLTSDGTDPAWAAAALAPTTTKGDISGFSTTQARIPVGTNNYSILADSAQALGLKYAASSTSTLTTTGDLLAASAANVLTRIAGGASGEILTGNGAGVLPTFQAAGGGGQLELVGTTATLDTTTYSDDCYHLAFTSIDMTTTSALVIYCSVPMDINTIGFRFNELTADYKYNGNVIYNNPSTSPTAIINGSNSANAFYLGYWALGASSMAFRWQIQTDLSGENDWMMMRGEGAGSNDGTGGNVGANWAGGNQTTDTSQAITSISCIEDGIDILVGGRLTVYKVTR